MNKMYVPYEYPAICIPRAVGTIHEDEIRNAFQESGLGDSYKVVIKPKNFVLQEWEQIRGSSTIPIPISIPRVDDNIAHPDNITHPDDNTISYNNIYVYFKKWNTENPVIKGYRDKLINGKTVKIVYESIPTPIFWRCVAAKFKSDDNKK